MSRELFDAIERHDLPALAALLAAGADANAVDARQPNWGPLKLAVGELADGGSIDAVGLLLRHGADPNGGADPSGCTPLVIATSQNRSDAVRLLAAAGADPNVRDDEGESPLRLAVAHRNLAVVELLLAAGAGRTIHEWGGFSGYSALGRAVANLDRAMIELLLAAGADPDSPGEFYETARDILERIRTESDPRAWDAAAAALGR